MPANTGAARGETLPLLPTHQQLSLYPPRLALLLGTPELVRKPRTGQRLPKNSVIPRQREEESVSLKQRVSKTRPKSQSQVEDTSQDVGKGMRNLDRTHSMVQRSHQWPRSPGKKGRRKLELLKPQRAPASWKEAPHSTGPTFQKSVREGGAWPPAGAWNWGTFRHARLTKTSSLRRL